MTLQGFSTATAAQGLDVIRAGEFRVSDGANLGDPMAEAGECMLDDVYSLDARAQRWRLALLPEPGKRRFRIAPEAQIGRPGAAVHLDCCATFMAYDGAPVEVLVLVELESGSDLIAATYLAPLSPLRPRTEYALIATERQAAETLLAHLGCVSFARGTRIAMASGAPCPIENIRPGDRVLTRDSGAQEVRWVGHRTLRAAGAFAPIVFAPGAINNAAELHLSANQRLFFYQREDRLRTGRAEVLVRAEHLVNGDTVTRGTGGYVDFFQILFDAPEFVFAEGVAAESLTVDPGTREVVPADVADRLATAHWRAGGPRPVDLPPGLLDPAAAAATLRGLSAL